MGRFHRVDPQQEIAVALVVAVVEIVLAIISHQQVVQQSSEVPPEVQPKVQAVALRQSLLVLPILIWGLECLEETISIEAAARALTAVGRHFLPGRLLLQAQIEASELPWSRVLCILKWLH
jgi:hypothetical protein